MGSWTKMALMKMRLFNKKEVNSDCPHKPIGSTKKMIASHPSMEMDFDTNCQVSVEYPCKSPTLGCREYFKKYGYLIIKNLYDPKEFREDPPNERGSFYYYGKIDRFSHDPEEGQVNGSLARYNYPKFRYAHSQIRLKLEKIIGEELYNTYYYDRFYFSGQRLDRHTDRDACEISLTYQISANSKKKWPICVQTPDGEERYIELNDGDAVLYKGCEIDHWREPLFSRHNFIQKLLIKNDDTYHHQVFFHYVKANGIRCHFANDTK